MKAIGTLSPAVDALASHCICHRNSVPVGFAKNEDDNTPVLDAQKSKFPYQVKPVVVCASDGVVVKLM